MNGPWKEGEQAGFTKEVLIIAPWVSHHGGVPLNKYLLWAVGRKIFGILLPKELFHNFIDSRKRSIVSDMMAFDESKTNTTSTVG